MFIEEYIPNHEPLKLILEKVVQARPFYYFVKITRFKCSSFYRQKY